MISRFLSSSRFLLLFAVVASFLAAAALLVYSGLTVIRLVIDIFSSIQLTPDSAKELGVKFIQLVDIILLSIVLYIVALGLYELFIDDTLPTPNWLHITSLDDLKERLISVIIVMLAATFLGYVIEWDKSIAILALGLGIAAVIAALWLFIARRPGQAHQRDEQSNPEA